MGLGSGSDGSESRFAAYVETLTAALGHADRAAPFQSYCAGLLLPGERKSVEPMAARVEPQRVQAAHQSLHHFVAKADWSDDAVLAAVRARVLPSIEQHGVKSLPTATPFSRPIATPFRLDRAPRDAAYACYTSPR